MLPKRGIEHDSEQGSAQGRRVADVRLRHILCGNFSVQSSASLFSQSPRPLSLLIGVLAVLAATYATQAVAAGPEAHPWSMSGFLEALSWTGGQLVEGARAFYSRAPALALGILCVVLLLPLAVVAFGVRALLGAQRASRQPETPDVSERTSLVTGFSRPRRACLEGDELGETGPVEIRRSLTRIGRADDNEVVINNTDLEPYHAAIERTPECDIYLCDLTRGGRRAARVNGRRAPRQRLCDGDVITLGRVKLTYRTSAL